MKRYCEWFVHTYPPINFYPLRYADAVGVVTVDLKSTYFAKKIAILSLVQILRRLHSVSISLALNSALLFHSDIGDKFMHAVDARSNMRVASDYELKDGDIISIITRQ